MARNARSSKRSTDSRTEAQQAIRDSAQKIWLAGLGAFERAKSDGPKMFESLVEQGRNMGARAVGMADEALKNMRQSDFSGGRWDKLEQVFEDRVSKSLSRLGVITNREVEELSRQVQELNETVRGMMAGKPSKAARPKRAASKAGARKRRGSPPRGQDRNSSSRSRKARSA